MSEETPGKQTLVKISDLPRKRSECFVSVYSNHVEATPGFYELRLTFCQIVTDSEAKPVSEQQVAVAMAWEHAIRVRDLFSRLIEGYEREHGKIRPLQEPSEGPDQPPPQ
jgi:hypothetical protein